MEEIKKPNEHNHMHDETELQEKDHMHDEAKLQEKHHMHDEAELQEKHHMHDETELQEHNHRHSTNIHHGHYHSPDEKKKQLNRLARAMGHLRHVQTMIEDDEDCADVLIQLSAVNSALHNLGKEIINEHMTHCIAHALEDGDTRAVEEFQEAIRKFV